MSFFRMNLFVPGDVGRATSPLRAFDPDLDDLNSILGVVCTYLGEIPGTVFAVTVGGEEWPVDVAIDLRTVLEQLAEALDALASTGTCVLSFYEQGMERDLVVVRERTRTRVEVRRLGAKHSEQCLVIADDPDVVPRTLSELFDSFYAAVQTHCPEAEREAAFSEWVLLVKTNLQRLKPA